MSDTPMTGGELWPEPVWRVGIVGCGTMGSGLAEVCASAGLDVVVAVPGAHSVETGRSRVMISLDRAVAKGRTTQEQRAAVLDRVTFSKELQDLADRQLVIEAIREHEADKVAVFRELDQIVADEGAVLASTTSSIPIIRLARATTRPGRVMGMHFFSPVPAMPLVELVRSLRTDDGVFAQVEAFATRTLGKHAVYSADRAGFIVNGLLIPYLLGAMRLVENGVASAQTVDTAMVLGCSHPVGPLRLADLIGLDVIAAVAEALYAEFKEQLYAPPPILQRMIESGFLGRKSGRGFYEYQ